MLKAYELVYHLFEFRSTSRKFSSTAFRKLSHRFGLIPMLILRMIPIQVTARIQRMQLIRTLSVNLQS